MCSNDPATSSQPYSSNYSSFFGVFSEVSLSLRSRRISPRGDGEGVGGYDLVGKDLVHAIVEAAVASL